MNVLKVIPTVSFLLWRGFISRLLAKYVIKDFHPLVFFYFFGIGFLIVGTILGLVYSALRLLTGAAIPTATIVLVAMLIIGGLQFLLFAMWFDMEYNKTLK